MCVFTTLCISSISFQAARTLGTRIEVWRSHRGDMFASVSVTAEVETFAAEIRLALWLMGPLRKLFWPQLHTDWICIRWSTWLWACVWLSAFVDVFESDVKYLLSRSCSGFKMFRNFFFSCCGRKKNVLRQNPQIRRHTFPGTSRQLIYLREEEMKAVGCTQSFHCTCACVCTLRIGSVEIFCTHVFMLNYYRC